MLARAAAVPAVRFLDPAFHDRLSRASGDLGGRLAQWTNSLLDLCRATVTAAGLVGAVFALGGGPALAGVLVLGALPVVLAQGRLTAIERARADRVARPRRVAGAWAGLLTGRQAAPEVRLFDLHRWLRAQWLAAYTVAAREDASAAGRRFAWSGFAQGVNTGAYGVVLTLVVAAAGAAGRAGAAGVFTGLLQAASWMQRAVGAIIDSAAQMHEQAALMADVAGLLAEPVSEGEGLQGLAASAAGRPAGVLARGVTFRYPAMDADVLAGVSFRVRPGEVVALVGPNGAGKSTLSALLLGLYAADGGTLTVGDGEAGVPVRRSAVFQDFVRFTLPVRDNVGFGDLARLGDDAALRGALRRAGSHLEEDLEAWLGPEFDGRDLSGGEWLRVAIARGVLPESGLIVLDEPTAAIDPLAEVDLVRRLLELGRGRTAIVVSHRLGIARMADRILVMEEGRVVEEGTHAALLDADGLYARMWRAQASWYRPVPAAE